MTERQDYEYIITVSGDDQPVERVPSMRAVFALVQFWVSKGREITIERIER